MLKKFWQDLQKYKYRATIFALLGMATIVCFVLVRFRIEYSDTYRYIFLIWNLFLAWIPFGISYITYTMMLARKSVYIIIPITAFLWLIFFPNAPYILTDLQHLSNASGAVPVWYDVVMLIWFSWTGLLLGIISLYLMQEVVRREFGRITGWIFVLTVILLSSVGIYIGRFMRLNSWDILSHPFGIALNLWSYASDPSWRSIGFIGLYTSFFIFIYITLYAFGHLFKEHVDKV
jgi:uncharacterized membrane protein